MTQNRTDNGGSGRSWAAAFVLSQVVVVAAVIAVARAKMTQEAGRLALPPLRNEPLEVKPLYNNPQIVSDEQLRAVMTKLRPRLRGPQPRIYNLDHALRFCGAQVKFRDPKCLSGAEIRNLLLDHADFHAAWGAKAKPLLIHDALGVGDQQKEGLATSSHVDHVLSALAEAGTTLDFPVCTAGGRSTVRDMVVRSLRRFSLNQAEADFSAMVFALYLASGRPWVSSEGQQITFDRLADRLMRESLADGPCYGSHRLYDLALFLRVHQQQPILSPECQARITAHLRHVTSVLVASQHAEGYWDQQWSGGAPVALEADEPEEEEKLHPLSPRLLVTGHALEWWAIAPREVLPPEEVMVRAGQWLVRSVSEMSEEDVREGYAFLTHIGRALALWRGQFPSAVLARLEAESVRLATGRPSR